MTRLSHNLGRGILLLGAIALVMGTAFVVQGISKSNVITEAMRIEQATYGGAEGIEDIVDTSEEAAIMAGVIRGHRLEMGIYTEMENEDPRRETMLKAMTMENALNLAQLGYGVTTMAIVSGIFMIIIGIALGGTGIGLYRLGEMAPHS